MDWVFDIGSTRVHLAVIAGGALRGRIATAARPPELERELEAALELGPPTRAVIVSVRPSLNAVLGDWLRRRTGVAARVIGVDLPIPVPRLAEAPRGAGHDRFMHAVWAAWRHPGRRCLVVSFGTALVVDLIAEDGAFLGGAIAPGLGPAAAALAGRTEQLPEVRPTEAPPLPGRDTEAAIRAGLFWGLVGAADRICQEMGAEDARVVATGGDAALVAPRSRVIEEVVEDLALWGAWRSLELGGEA